MAATSRVLEGISQVVISHMPDCPLSGLEPGREDPQRQPRCRAQVIGIEQEDLEAAIAQESGKKAKIQARSLTR
jgi:hypothetical protein